MRKKPFIIATRGSQLAVWQANWVGECLKKFHPDLAFDLLLVHTQADRMPYLSLTEAGGKGLFVKELEEALLEKRADIAVHSLKDMAVNLPDGLTLAAVCKRENPWDVLVSNQVTALRELPKGAVVGTSSLRRQSQLMHLRPDLKTLGIRGNVLTRVTRLDSGEFDAIILAAAGLNRLGIAARGVYEFPPNEILPAAGQGALAVECRRDDEAIKALVAKINDADVAACTNAERAVCRGLEAGCHVPVAAYAEIKDENIYLRGLVASLDGKTILRAEYKDKKEKSEDIGKKVADDLLNQGAEKILKCL